MSQQEDAMLAVRPLHPVLAAEITGLDLRKPPGAGLAREIEEIMDRYAVSVLPGQFIDDAAQVRFSAMYGDLEVRPLQRLKKQVPDAGDRITHSEVFDVSNLDDDGNPLKTEDDRRIYSLGNRLWHTDSSFRQLSATYSMLSARVIPPAGADTEFVDMRAAYDALPDKMKARLDELVAEHSIWHSRSKHGGYVPNAEERAARPRAHHPIVRTHAGSGRKALYIASHASHVLGMNLEEGRALLAELMAF